MLERPRGIGVVLSAVAAFAALFVLVFLLGQAVELVKPMCLSTKKGRGATAKKKNA